MFDFSSQFQLKSLYWRKLMLVNGIGIYLSDASIKTLFRKTYHDNNYYAARFFAQPTTA